MLGRAFLLGFIGTHISHHANEEPIFGTEIAEELSRHGYSFSPGTLYPTLHRLEKEGYLVRKSKIVDGKVRKYYNITEAGRKALEQSRKQIKELAEEVLE